MLRADDEVGVERAGRGVIGALPLSWYRKPAAVPRSGSGSSGSRPVADAPNAARAEGAIAVSVAGLLDGRRPAGRLLRAPGRDGGAQRIHGVAVDGRLRSERHGPV